MKFFQFVLEGKAKEAYREITRTPISVRIASQNFRNGMYNICMNNTTTDPYSIAILYCIHVNTKRPYYRLWPGFVEQIERLPLPETVPYFNLGIDSLEIDFSVEPESSSPLQEWELYLKSLLLQQVNPEAGSREPVRWIITSYGTRPDGSTEYYTVTLPHDDLLQLSQSIPRIIYALYLVKNNPDIVSSRVLAKDLDKFQATGDPKYIEKAHRLGVFGYDIGKDIPTKADIERMRKENATALANGQKCPHIRASHLHLYWTGQGRVTPVIKLIKETFVNIDKMKEIPQGYYDEHTNTEKKV